MHILAIDQGTTGTTTVCYDERGRRTAAAYREVTARYPHSGWVDQDPNEIWDTVVDTVTKVLAASPDGITAVGITNQRETTIIWNRTTGEPVGNAIVWQCRRTADICRSFSASGDMIRAKTGLPLDAYFSATKIVWLLDHMNRRDTSDLLFGTVDTWLIWKLTGGAVHATDPTNASRTLLFDIDNRRWDPELTSLFGIPSHLLPEVRRSAADFGTITAIEALRDVPVHGVAGDQQAALFGQACFTPGSIKNTYGTGCFMVMNTGRERIHSRHGLLSTVAVDGTGNPCYALEGSIFSAGATVQWLRDGLGIVDTAKECEDLARQVSDADGVYIVPAFTGLGAPHWNMSARGTITGLSRGTDRRHLARAAIEAMAFQSLDVLEMMEEDSGVRTTGLRVDGGATANELLLQFQSDLIDRPVIRPVTIESTSLGAAMLAGLASGLWTGTEELAALNPPALTLTPHMEDTTRHRLLKGWRHALRQTMCR